LGKREDIKPVRLNPRGEVRKQELAEIAERVFLRNGFADTTMQMIAKEARASKETLYRYFVCKESLFSEIVRHRAARILGPDGAIDRDAPPAEALFRFGYSLLRALIKPEGVALYRVVIAETPRAPELGRVFWSEGPRHVQEQLTNYLAAAIDKGELTCKDPVLACRLFLGAVAANHQAMALTASPFTPPSEDQAQDHVREAVAMFMARYQAGRDQ
jgi:TetR/AcrR family transcriptional regulator, mexJK operon transcriptional repressor